MKIIVLVQSCLKDPFYAMMKKQQETWDADLEPNIKTVYYYGDSGTGLNKIKENCFEYGANTSDEYTMMHWKFALCLKEMIADDWDFVFRTNSSSYINKSELLKFAETLPKEKCYCGIDGGNFASGCGVFLSRDCTDIILKEFTDEPVEAEDCRIGSTLLKYNIGVTPGAKRIHYNYVEPHTMDLTQYHIRCKSENSDRSQELFAFEYLYNKLKK